MKDIFWLGSSYDDLLEFPKEARKEVGFNLHRVQVGLEPYDCKSMPSIGSGVKEIRIHSQNEYRVVYVAKYKEAIYVLHSFVKKTQQTRKSDINLAKERLKEIEHRGNDMAIQHITKGSVLNDLGLSRAEASNLKIRAELMKVIEKFIHQRHLKQVDVAHLLGTSQPRVNDLLNGKINKFTIDALVKIAFKLGADVSFSVKLKEAA